MAKMLTEGSPARLIWGFTLPLLAGNIFQQMYAFVDTLVVGRFLGVEALAAVGCTGGLMFLLMGFVIGTATGLSIYTGQRYGARDMAGVRKSAAACFLLAALIGVTVAAVSVLGARPVLLLMQTPPEILEVHQYHRRQRAVSHAFFHAGQSHPGVGRQPDAHLAAGFGADTEHII